MGRGINRKPRTHGKGELREYLPACQSCHRWAEWRAGSAVACHGCWTASLPCWVGGSCPALHGHMTHGWFRESSHHLSSRQNISSTSTIRGHWQGRLPCVARFPLCVTTPTVSTLPLSLLPLVEMLQDIHTYLLHTVVTMHQDRKIFHSNCPITTPQNKKWTGHCNVRGGGTSAN